MNVQINNKSITVAHDYLRSITGDPEKIGDTVLLQEIEFKLNAKQEYVRATLLEADNGFTYLVSADGSKAWLYSLTNEKAIKAAKNPDISGAGH